MSAASAEITRPATVASLPDLLAVLDETVEAAGGDDDLLFPLHLAAEEACTNVITHGYAGREPGPLTLRVDVTEAAVALTLTDAAAPFDPSAVPTPDLDADPMDRPIGGLGWHLIRETMDEIRHEAVPGGGNRVTLIKHRPTPQ